MAAEPGRGPDEQARSGAALMGNVVLVFLGALAAIVGALVPLALVVWLLYTVIWTGVRRGMREYYREKVVEDYLVELDLDEQDEQEEESRSEPFD